MWVFVLYMCVCIWLCKSLLILALHGGNTSNSIIPFSHIPFLVDILPCACRCVRLFQIIIVRRFFLV